MAGEIRLGGVTLATESGGTITLTSDVDTVTPTKTALNASGSAPIYACRAWVNFNGTGTVAIRASGNVSSITDQGTGQYDVNFTTTMPDANYSWSVNSDRAAAPISQISSTSQGPNSSTIRVFTYNTSLAVQDCLFVVVAIFR